MKNVQANMNIDISTLDDVVCSTCGSIFWEQCFVLKKVSAIISPTGQGGIINVPTLVCKKCGQSVQDNLDSEV